MRITNAEDFGRVAVMMGGDSSEREVSLDSGNAVLAALQSKGVAAEAWDPAENNLAAFVAEGFDRVWIALHGPGGEDGALQGALEWHAVPYTGSGVMASALAMDKVRSKHLFRVAGIATPEYASVDNYDDAKRAADRIGYPLIAKPSGQGSSVGMARIPDAAALHDAFQLAKRYGDVVLLEEYIVGEEFTVGVLHDRALPSIRIATPREFYDYRAKYQSERTEYHCPGTRSEHEEQRYGELAMAAFRELGCSGWGRVDFMTGKDGQPQVLEVNTVPGMTSHSLVPKAAQQVGIGFAELCWRILETSWRAGNLPANVEVAANGA